MQIYQNNSRFSLAFEIMAPALYIKGLLNLKLKPFRAIKINIKFWFRFRLRNLNSFFLSNWKHISVN